MAAHFVPDGEACMRRFARFPCRRCSPMRADELGCRGNFVEGFSREGRHGDGWRVNLLEKIHWRRCRRCSARWGPRRLWAHGAGIRGRFRRLDRFAGGEAAERSSMSMRAAPATMHARSIAGFFVGGTCHRCCRPRFLAIGRRRCSRYPGEKGERQRRRLRDRRRSGRRPQRAPRGPLLLSPVESRCMGRAMCRTAEFREMGLPLWSREAFARPDKRRKHGGSARRGSRSARRSRFGRAGHVADLKRGCSRPAAPARAVFSIGGVAHGISFKVLRLMARRRSEVYAARERICFLGYCGSRIGSRLLAGLPLCREPIADLSAKAASGGGRGGQEVSLHGLAATVGLGHACAATSRRGSRRATEYRFVATDAGGSDFARGADVVRYMRVGA